MNILVKFPTRGRPVQFTACLREWIAKLSGKHLVTFLVSQDKDDPSRHDVYSAFPSCDVGHSAVLEFIEGSCASKIEAINYGIDDRVFDILISAADDMWPIAQGYDATICRHMAEYFPALDGALGYCADPQSNYPFFTLAILGYKLYREFGYIYNPEFFSLHADIESCEICARTGRLVAVPGWQADGKRLIEHRHPLLTGAPYDALYTRNNTWGPDAQILNQHRAVNYGLVDAHPRVEVGAPLVSVIMPTANRPQFILGAIRQFSKQKYSAKELVIIDNGRESIGDLIRNLLGVESGIHYMRAQAGITIGQARNIGVEAAHADIVASMDDDDFYGENYLARRVRELCSSEKQLLGFHSWYYWDAQRSLAFKYQPWAAPYAHGATQIYRREFWKAHPFEHDPFGTEDLIFSRKAQTTGVLGSRFGGTDFVGRMHGGNISIPNTAVFRGSAAAAPIVPALLPNAFFKDFGIPLPVDHVMHPKRVNVIAAQNGLGLQVESVLLGDWLRQCGCEVAIVDWIRPQGAKPADINIFDEQFKWELCKLAPVNFLIVHPEWFYSWEGQLGMLAKVICKTRDCQREMGVLTDRAVYTGFWSRDLCDPEVRRESFWFHLGGGGLQRNTEAVLSAWSRMGSTAPSLYIAGRNSWPAVPGVTQLGRIAHAELAAWMNRCQYHIMPSAYEGFGHAIREGMGCGAVVVTLDMPPMCDAVDPDTPRVRPLEYRRMRRATVGFTSADEIVRTVRETCQMDSERRQRISANNRRRFIDEGLAARGRMAQALGLVGMDDWTEHSVVSVGLERELTPRAAMTKTGNRLQ